MTRLTILALIALLGVPALAQEAQTPALAADALKRDDVATMIDKAIQTAFLRERSRTTTPEDQLKQAVDLTTRRIKDVAQVYVAACKAAGAREVIITPATGTTPGTAQCVFRAR